jgi:energy-coupling factor transport system ATP-binding protein
MKQKIIEVTHLHKVFSRKTPFEHEALKGVNLDVNDGEFLAIIGETGSGKSSLITHFNGLVKPSTGTVKVFDYEMKKSRRKIKKINDLRKRVGMVFQFPEYQLFEETVLKDVMFGPKNFGVPKEEAMVKAHKYIDELKLPPETKNRSPFDLSGGQKRKVALAGILAIETDVLIFDEPTAGLDPESEKEVLDICKDLNEKGKTIIFVTHNMENVLKYASRVAIMKNGRVIHTGTPQSTFKNGKLMRESNLDIPRIYKFLQKYHGSESLKEEINNKDALVELLLKSKSKKPTPKKGGGK